MPRLITVEVFLGVALLMAFIFALGTPREYWFIAYLIVYGLTSIPVIVLFGPWKSRKAQNSN
jgi:hypothetical protein